VIWYNGTQATEHTEGKMKIELSETFKEQIGADSIEEWEDRLFGKPGTYKRYVNDREQLKAHIKEIFITFLVFPLRFLPWGHIMATWWGFILTERFYSALDGMAFAYIGDAYVVGLRDALHGKKHTWSVEFDPEVKKPYTRYTLRYPLWLLTRLVWPQFMVIYKQRRKMYL
jgi:hypothetical protein